METSGLQVPSAKAGWEDLALEVRVVRLSTVARALVPALIVPTLPRSTRGFTFLPGKLGFAVGTVLVVASAGLAWLLWGSLGWVGALLPLWLFGTAGALTIGSAVRPMAFVKPDCVGCRLLPVIVEHEAIHLSGVGSEGAVWASMRLRHSTGSLRLDGDPTICSFCPIPKRLAEH